MEKIKINLVSGTSLEKPIVTAFMSNNASYVVVDNEMNGTMGLPIILVSRLDGNNLTKIEDQNEWGSVKEILRMIISGSQVDYIRTPNELSANDVFFSQLTLPVASFETLKNSYNPADSSTTATAPVAPEAPSTVEPTPVVEMPEVALVTSVTPEESETPQVVSGMGVDAQANEPVVNQTVETPVYNEPVVETTPVQNVEMPSPVMPSAPAATQTVAEVANIANESPVVEPVVPSEMTTPEVPVDFTADKEAFLKACENIFDALVAKFKN